jgi:hypothetical protein
MVVVLIIAGLLLSACGGTLADISEGEPASVEPIEGTDLNRVILTAKAAERLDIQTVPVREAEVVRKGAAGGEAELRMVIPYSAVLYGLNGDTFAYTNPEPLIFVQHSISIDYIDGDLAVLSDGPPSGTAVVTVGAAELYGTETGIGQ